MKNKKKILIISILIFVIFFIFYILIHNRHRIIPHVRYENKEWLLDHFFILEKVKILEKINYSKKKELAEVANLSGYIEFNKNTKPDEYIFNDKKIKLIKYTSNIPNEKEQGYLEYYNKNLFIVKANGIFSYININEFKNDSFKSYIIKSNIKNFIKSEDFYIKSGIGIKDLLIHDNKLYVSYSDEIQQGCFTTSILVAEIDFNYLNFEKFFFPYQCVKKNNSYGEFNSGQSGGRMQFFKDNLILLTIGEYKNEILAQDKISPFGKIIAIDIKSKNYKLISIGHRNPQGLHYDAVNNLILSTEHGPKGGDEVNIIIKPDNNDIKNYGWPISSYGEHYDQEYFFKTFSLRYKKAPLYKSHNDHGFIEPIIYFSPSIGLSQIIKLEKKYIGTDNNEIIFGTMSETERIKYGAMSLHHITLNKEYKIIKHEMFNLNERIRDMIYAKDSNKIYLYLESSGSIGILSSPAEE
jgi:hypothetical protein